MKGSAATRARVVSGLAISLALFTIGLKVAALLLRWPFAHDATLLEGLAETLLITLDVPYALVGALICARQPWNRIGWLLVVGGLANGGYVAVMYATRGQQQLANLPVTWMTGWLFWLTAFITLMFLLLLYPTGRLLSRRWRPMAWAVGVWGLLGLAAMVMNPELADPEFWNPVGGRGLGGQFATKAIESDVALGWLLVHRSRFSWTPSRQG